MTALGQRTLVSHLVNSDALDLLVREGLDRECIPDERLRGVVDFAVDYYHQNGRQNAPTEAVLRQHYGNLLDDTEITLGDAQESVEWAVDDLRASYVHKEASSFNKRFATEMAGVEIQERVEVLSEAASELVSLSLRMESREYSIDAREGVVDRLRAYAERADDAGRGNVRGMQFGMAEIDEYTLGIHPGELAILAAPPKTGKSFFLDKVALEEWRRGRTVALYTLENSVEMTLDRIACMATGVDARRWQRGECVPEEVQRMTEWVEQVQSSENSLYVLQPEERTAEALVRGAQLRGCDSIIIDQLSWLEHPNPRNMARHEQVRDILRSLKTLISTGRDRMSCLMAHQINREGAKAADKDGFLSMWHLAESAEVERSADWVFGLYQSGDERATMTAKFQTLASRREDISHFRLLWRINLGLVRVREAGISLED